MENKRSPCSVGHSGFTSLASKRQKSKKDRKDQIGERIVALQQLVSPYGKTDTASILLEAMEYIRFLHEQVKVLSAPYLQNIPTNNFPAESNYCLRNRGLCLVPISCTTGVACSSNGADIWAPMKTTSPKYDKVISQIN
ncbi:transcription factor bHLH153-like [Hibiscus syriacus]|uniref:transcription factor bHLH153-like n=1 Tax=Hibiscus syriacus TaxID=106335 RepID=UPI0019228BDF|nr:transcription factor bHLH153-like [Hibiscus syriacus]